MSPSIASPLVPVSVPLTQNSYPQPVPPDATIPEPQFPPTLPPPEELFPSPLPNSTPTEPDVEPSQTLVIERFIFEGNTAFTDEKLAEITQSFLNRPITFSELLQARSAVTDLYVSNGYITSGALIPPQTLEAGAVTIQIVEGEISELNIKGDEKLNSNYVRSRLKPALSKPLNQNRLLEALQLLQLNPVIATISAELSAGIRPGESILNVDFQTADTFTVRVFSDNSRPPSVGTFRRGVEVLEGNLFGQGDRFDAVYSNTDGSNIVDVSYDFPINSRNGTVGFYLNYTDSQVIESPFEDLEIEANSYTYELRYRQPIIRTPQEELTLGLALSRRETDTSILGVGFPLSRGAENDGETRLSIVRFYQEYVNRGGKQVLAARSQFSLGVGALDATINNNDEPDSRYLAWRGQAQWLRLLAPDMVLLIRSDIQLSNEELIPLEQIGLGGFETVRGYRQDLLLRDNAAFASVELRYPILRTSDGEGVLQLTPFVDLGRAWNANPELEIDSRTLFSVGLGLRWQYSDRLTLRFDWGIPLSDTESRERTLQEQGIYFSLDWNLF
ncbi:ShlB/FhaC/HecB family hemolysin secretion/activation protein [Capilliphycus salinus ALCB114379]|uniref:ShlB/FhaC/HecB family hemolysin secretion/activation protein n=1 Tax=Capilliphycus salinus TaxID=2768948 RepID=UPI0039A469BF